MENDTVTMSDEVEARIAAINAAYRRLKYRVYENQDISLKTRLMIFISAEATRVSNSVL
jgi:hypothetical protein